MGRAAALPGAPERPWRLRPKSESTRLATSGGWPRRFAVRCNPVSEPIPGIQIASRDGGMNADAHTPIHPGWRVRFRFRFGAVLVFGIEFSRLEDGLVRHAGGKFLLRHK